MSDSQPKCDACTAYSDGWGCDPRDCRCPCHQAVAGSLPSTPGAQNKCSTDVPHAAHTFGVAFGQIELCKGVPKPDCDGSLQMGTGQCALCMAYHCQWRRCAQCGRENSVETWSKRGGKCPNCGGLHDKEAGLSSAAPSERERLLEKARLKLFDYAVRRKRATPKDVEWYADFVNECAVARAAAPQAPAGRDLDAIFSALSKLESQILPDPSLPEACTLILREAWAAIRRMQSGAAAVPAPAECEGCKFGLETNHNLGPLCKLAPIPAKYVRLPRRVTGDFPFAHQTIAEPGIYEAHINPHGAVSVIAADGKELGVKPAEFEWVADSGATPKEGRDATTNI